MVQQQGLYELGRKPGVFLLAPRDLYHVTVVGRYGAYSENNGLEDMASYIKLIAFMRLGLILAFVQFPTSNSLHALSRS